MSGFEDGGYHRTFSPSRFRNSTGFAPLVLLRCGLLDLHFMLDFRTFPLLLAIAPILDLWYGFAVGSSTSTSWWFSGPLPLLPTHTNLYIGRGFSDLLLNVAVWQSQNHFLLGLVMLRLSSHLDCTGSLDYQNYD